MARPVSITKEKLKQAILAYFDSCEVKQEMPNRAGLCVHLDIVRDTYYRWAKRKDELSDTIKRFEELVENKWVQRLGGNSPTGAIFFLKNAFRKDWADRTETDITSAGKPLATVPELKK